MYYGKGREGSTLLCSALVSLGLWSLGAGIVFGPVWYMLLGCMFGCACRVWVLSGFILLLAGFGV
jgi:hypothetical protein